MIDVIRRFFGTSSSDPPHKTPRGSSHDVRVATCAVFLEMANIDGEFSALERDKILSLLEERFGLSRSHVEEIAAVAREELEGSIDMWRFTHLINENYSREEKLEVVRLVWKVVYADGHLNEHENYLVHKLGKMLRIHHRELIDAKLSVLHEGGDRA